MIDPLLENDDATPLTPDERDRKSTRLNSSHQIISYAVFCLKKKNTPIVGNIATILRSGVIQHCIERTRSIGALQEMIGYVAYCHLAYLCYNRAVSVHEFHLR